MLSALTILYEDNHCLAVAKPAALLTQGVPPGIITLESMVKDYLREKYGKTGRVYLGIPQRLDRPVSGVVLFARQTKSAQRLAEQFRTRIVVKTYWAAVEGDVQPADGVWEDFLLKVQDEARSMVVTREMPGSRQAVSRYRKLASLSEGTLLELMPETGRMHQLRIQAAARGWPVQGDLLYGAKRLFGPPALQPRERNIALHARRLTFLHPIHFRPITVEAPLPDSWLEFEIPADVLNDRSRLSCVDDSP